MDCGSHETKSSKTDLIMCENLNANNNPIKKETIEASSTKSPFLIPLISPKIKKAPKIKSIQPLFKFSLKIVIFI